MSVATVIGFYRATYNFEDGKSISGYNIYCTSPLDSDRGEGLMSERVFMSDHALERVAFDPFLNAKVDVQYNNKGKRVIVQANLK